MHVDIFSAEDGKKRVSNAFCKKGWGGYLNELSNIPGFNIVLVALFTLAAESFAELCVRDACRRSPLHAGCFHKFREESTLQCLLDAGCGGIMQSAMR